MAKVYILKHPGYPDVNGQFGPITWVNGIGSTVSEVDRNWAVDKLGATDVTDEYPPREFASL